MTRYRHLITDDNRKWWTLGAMCFALFMIMLDNTVVNVALPSIQRDLHASISGLEWTTSGYTLSFAVVLATGGRLGDIFGRRLVFLIGVVIFALSSATAGLAPDQTALVVSRVVQGIGAGLMMPGTLSIITDAFPAHERGKAMGTWAGVSALALAIGPVLGGLLTEHVSWRAIFYLNIPVAIGAIAATVFAVRESRDTSVGRDVDYLGVATLTTGLTALVLALVEGNSWGWGSPAIIGLLAASIIGLTAFVFVEKRVKAPIVQFELLSHRNYLGASIVALIITFAMMGTFFFLALYMQNILHYSPLQAGVRFLPSTLMIVAVAPISGRLADRFGPRWLIAGGLTLLTASLLTFTQVAVDSTYTDLLPGIRPARHRDRVDDVADDERRDERGPGSESRRRLRRALDVPDDRRQPRRRRHRGDLPELRRRRLRLGHAPGIRRCALDRNGRLRIGHRGRGAGGRARDPNQSQDRRGADRGRRGGGESGRRAARRPHLSALRRFRAPARPSRRSDRARAAS